MLAAELAGVWPTFAAAFAAKAKIVLDVPNSPSIMRAAFGLPVGRKHSPLEIFTNILQLNVDGNSAVNI